MWSRGRLGIGHASRHGGVRRGPGFAALEHLLREDFVVILLAVQMPGINGLEIAGLNRQGECTRVIPTVFVTAAHDAVADPARG